MTQTTTAPAPAPAPAQPRAGSSPGPKIAAIVAGALAALAGLAIAAIGALVLGVFGSDGTVASGSHSFSTSRAALVAPLDDVQGISDLSDVVGDPRVRVTATATGSDQELFVGIGPAAQVDRYLADTPIDEVTDFELDPFTLDRRPRGGASKPAAPAEQGFWQAQATGARSASMDWKVSDGDHRLVLMNADGSRGVEADGSVGLTMSNVPTVAWLLIGGGLLIVLGGAAGIVLGARGLRASRR
jgi:hypothetical protein